MYKLSTAVLCIQYTKFEAVVRSEASHDPKGTATGKDVIIKVTNNKTKKVGYATQLYVHCSLMPVGYCTMQLVYTHYFLQLNCDKSSYDMQFDRYGNHSHDIEQRQCGITCLAKGHNHHGSDGTRTHNPSVTRRTLYSFHRVMFVISQCRGKSRAFVLKWLYMAMILFQVWVWSMSKFYNRKDLMDELYLKWLDGDSVIMTRDKDPFWDPVEDVFLGRYVRLISVQYMCMYSIIEIRIDRHDIIIIIILFI